MTESFNTTQSASHFLPTDEPGERHWALSIVYHSDPRYVGARRTLDEGACITLARGASVFVSGALDDPRLSRKHAEVVCERERLFITDLDSRNGTFVDGQRVFEKTELEIGQVVGAGNLLFLVHKTPPVYREPRHPTLVGVSYSIRRVLDQVALVAARPTSVLILGETGVGKELVAREIHAQSGRTGNFVAVNCGSISDGVMQSELFGHVRGAFSGAHRQRQGLVEEARGGTLFLDEIGDASPNLQVSMLRLLQDNEVRPVGGNRTFQADVRFVAATHRALGSDSFRQDLWARLSRWVIRIDPLRERLVDVPHLMAYFGRRYAHRRVRLTARLVHALLGYSWPGNVRELDAIMERICVEGAGSEVLDLPSWLPKELELRKQAAVEAGADRAELDGPESGDDDATTRPMRLRSGRRKRLSREELTVELRQHQGNVKAVAETLGIGRNTVYRWMREMDIDLDSIRRSARD